MAAARCWADDAPHRRPDVRRPDRAAVGTLAARWSARPTSACRSARPARPRCCRELDARSATGLAVAAGRGPAVSWRCARRRTIGCSATCRGCGRTCWAPSRPTPGASWSTPRAGGRWSPQFDPTNPEALQEALIGDGLFEPETPREQKAALARLETALALVEGWVDTVVHAGRADRCRRPRRCGRRCAGAAPPVARPSRPSPRWSASSCGRAGCARPPRSVGLVTDARGIDGRDAVWAHPDLLPTAEDLDDPDGFVAGKNELDMSELEAGPAAAPGEDGTPGDTPGDEGTPQNDAE